MASIQQSPAGSAGHVVACSTLKSYRVLNFAGQDLGKVDDIAVDLGTGRLSYVIISLGGFLGIGDKLFAVPWELFSVRFGDPHLLIDIDKQMLQDAPCFERSAWPELGDPAWASAIQSHYAQKPYWNSDITDAGDYVGDDDLDKPNRDRL